MTTIYSKERKETIPNKMLPSSSMSVRQYDSWNCTSGLNPSKQTQESKIENTSVRKNSDSSDEKCVP